MFLRGTGDRWHWSTSADQGVNFCLWVLQVDGLRVPPFEHHADGDASLRAAGLTAEAWQEWLERILGLHRELRALIQAGTRPAREHILPLSQPYATWQGEPAIGALIADLWPSYAAQAEAWERRHTPDSDQLRLRPAEYRQLWRQLKPFRDQSPPMHLFLVEYPRAVLAAIPPDTVVIGTGADSIDPASYASSVLRAAEALARSRAA